MLLLGDISVRSVISAMHLFGTIAVTLIGIVFFFAIVGVFGLPAAIVALALFISRGSWRFSPDG
jgi:hypothetical protein